MFARNRDTAVPAEGNCDLQTLICVIVAKPRRCLTLSNPVPGQNWMAAYLGYTLRMRTLFRGWPIMVNDTHTRRRRRTAVSVLWNHRYADCILGINPLLSKKASEYGPEQPSPIDWREMAGSILACNSSTHWRRARFSSGVVELQLPWTPAGSSQSWETCWTARRWTVKTVDAYHSLTSQVRAGSSWHVLFSAAPMSFSTSSLVTVLRRLWSHDRRRDRNAIIIIIIITPFSECRRVWNIEQRCRSGRCTNCLDLVAKKGSKLISRVIISVGCRNLAQTVERTTTPNIPKITENVFVLGVGFCIYIQCFLCTLGFAPKSKFIRKILNDGGLGTVSPHPCTDNSARTDAG